ncbi:hypothetical protein ACOME3_005348 [Neoechinorhynchus agilis]
MSNENMKKNWETFPGLNRMCRLHIYNIKTKSDAMLVLAHWLLIKLGFRFIDDQGELLDFIPDKYWITEGMWESYYRCLSYKKDEKVYYLTLRYVGKDFKETVENHDDEPDNIIFKFNLCMDVCSSDLEIDLSKYITNDLNHCELIYKSIDEIIPRMISVIQEKAGDVTFDTTNTTFRIGRICYQPIYPANGLYIALEAAFNEDARNAVAIFKRRADRMLKHREMCALNHHHHRHR